MKKAPRTLAVGVAIAALALTGCANSAADAATVGGVRIADNSVRQAAVLISEASGADSALALKQATYDMVLGEAGRQIAASRGIAVSGAEKSAVLAQYPAAAAVAATPEGAAWGDAVTTAFVVQDKLGVERYAEDLQKMAITVNPRYGAWDATHATFRDASLSSMADPTTLRR